MPTKVYLIGSAPKNDNEVAAFQDWRMPYMSALRDELGEVELLDFNDIIESAGPTLVFGHDCNCIKRADFIIANAPNKIGAGTAMEMVIAKHFSKPLITVLPKDTHHRKSNIISGGKTIADWIHPFIYSVSDEIVETVEQAAQKAKTYITETSKPVKTMGIIDEAIEKYTNFSNNN